MGSQYTCDKCGIVCSKFYNLKRHAKHKHNVEMPGKCKENDTSSHHANRFRALKCCICDVEGSTQELDLHYIQVHEIDLNIEKIEFTSLNTFHEWKTAIEKENHCRYVAACGRKYNHERYKCHRSGDFRSKSKGVRLLKKQGSKKIGAYCPSKIIVNKKGNVCTAKFYRTHVGHENELCHVSLTADVRAEIANKLSQNVPPAVLLEELKNSMRGINPRINMLTLKDLYNISKGFKIDIRGDVNLGDENNVDKLVNALKNADAENPVVFYKPFGETDDSYPEFEPDDFALIMMNKTQSDLLQHYNKNTVILDRTSKISYNLHLIMLLILDDDHQAFPCCFLFTNNDSEFTLNTLFTILKSRLGMLKTFIFMSCVSEQYYKAWTSVMGAPEYHVYSPWSVNQTWVAHMNKIENQEKQSYVTNMLKELSEEPDAAKFPSLLNKTVQTITRDEDTSQYGQYFCKYYLQNVVKWARCYQMQLGLKDTSDLEKVCKMIKVIYFNFKKRGDLNDCISFLYRFLREKLFNKKVAYSKAEIFRQQQCLKKNHDVSIAKSYSNAINQSGGWILISPTEKTVYEIKKQNTDCKCEISCDKCNTCVHCYVCSCTDSSIEWNMCYHIHYLCAYLERSIDDDVIVVNDTVTFVNDSISHFSDSNDRTRAEPDDRALEFHHLSDDEDDPAEAVISDGALDNNTQINAVLEINGLMDEIILNMDSQQTSEYVISNLKKMLEVIKSKKKDPLRSIEID
ncbi:uncharacterized protein LOC135835966 [Planococcus citri]|uniref:uncharacterized protein LOC135835966 n=1 Tax=Planococcus citri TaxID=170843 RepID=UPI0031FA3661